MLCVPVRGLPDTLSDSEALEFIEIVCDCDLPVVGVSLERDEVADAVPDQKPVFEVFDAFGAVIELFELLVELLVEKDTEADRSGASPQEPYSD